MKTYRWPSVLTWVVWLIAAGIMLSGGLVCSATGAEVAITATSFPPGQELGPGVAVVLQVSGLDAKAVPIWHDGDVAGDMMLEFGTTMRLFAGTTAGPRTFIVQVPVNGADPFVVLTFDYGGPSPNPTPPPPVPTPDNLAIVVVGETTQRTAAQATTMLGLRKYLDSRPKLWWRIVDPDIKDSQTNQTPEWYLPIQAALKGKQLPVVVVGSRDLQGVVVVVAVDALPPTATEAVALVKRYEVK